jgi:hypothetical protein
VHRNARNAMLVMLPHAGFGAAPAARFAHVAAQYAPLRKDPSLFEPQKVRAWFDDQFLELVDAVTSGAEAPFIIQEVTREVYKFPLLKEEACRALCDEVAHFATTGIEARRPNSMNNYGLILNDIGLRPSLDALQTIMHPVAKALFPVEGQVLDDHVRRAGSEPASLRRRKLESHSPGCCAALHPSTDTGSNPTRDSTPFASRIVLRRIAVLTVTTSRIEPALANAPACGTTSGSSVHSAYGRLGCDTQRLPG